MDEESCQSRIPRMTSCRAKIESISHESILTSSSSGNVVGEAVIRFQIAPDHDNGPEVTWSPSSTKDCAKFRIVEVRS